MKMVVPQEVLDKATAMRGLGISWGRIARAVGFGEERIRRILDPGFAARRAAGIRQARYTREFRGAPRMRLSDKEAAEALAAVPPDTRSLTGRMFGDPLPGRSALERGSFPRVKRNENSEVARSPGITVGLVDAGTRTHSIEDHLSNGRVV